MESTYFTIFTSLYNRKHTVHRVWESLINQTNKNFEWIIIDNGSQDDVKPLLDEYIKKADFDIKVYYQENQGKYKAFNRAVDLAKGELFIPADSDDRFLPNTIERFDQIWQEHKKETISGITVLCQDEEGKTVGKKFPLEISNYLDMNYKFKVNDEKWGCIRVDVLRKYKFPTNFEAKFFPDDYVWAQIGANYNTVFVNEPLRVYYHDAGNQITKDKKRSRSIEYLQLKNFHTLWKVNYLLPKIRKYITTKKYIATYMYLWHTSFKCGVSAKETLGKIENNSNKFLALVLYVPSLIASKLK